MKGATEQEIQKQGGPWEFKLTFHKQSKFYTLSGHNLEVSLYKDGKKVEATGSSYSEKSSASTNWKATKRNITGFYFYTLVHQGDTSDGITTTEANPTGLGDLQCGLRAFGDHVAFGLTDEGQHPQAKAIHVRVVTTYDFDTGIQDSKEVGGIATQPVQFRAQQRCTGPTTEVQGCFQLRTVLVGLLPTLTLQELTGGHSTLAGDVAADRVLLRFDTEAVQTLALGGNSTVGNKRLRHCSQRQEDITAMGLGGLFFVSPFRQGGDILDI